MDNIKKRGSLRSPPSRTPQAPASVTAPRRMPTPRETLFEVMHNIGDGKTFSLRGCKDSVEDGDQHDVLYSARHDVRRAHQEQGEVLC